MQRTLALALITGLALAASPALAGPPRSKPATAGPKAPKLAATAVPKARPTAAGPKVRAAGPKVSQPKATGPKTPKTTGPKATASPKTATSPKGAKPPKAASTVPATTTLTVKSNVPKNPKLAARLQAMLPAGMTMEQAALGFKNQGQFIAAINVANNKGIPFADLKASMVDGGLSLGQSIQQLKPSVDGEVEAARAMRWAEEQLEPR